MTIFWLRMQRRTGWPLSMLGTGLLLTVGPFALWALIAAGFRLVQCAGQLFARLVP